MATKGYRAPVQRVVDLGVCTVQGKPTDGSEPVVCGVVHQSCKAHKQYSLDRNQPIPCGANAAVGQLVCSRHGAKLPQSIAAAERRQADAEAEKVLRRKLGISDGRVIRNPTIALARLAGEIEQAKEAAADLVGELMSPQVATATGFDVHPYVKLYERLLDQYRGVLVDMARIGIEDRIAGVEELQAQLTLAAVLAGLQDAGVDRPEVRAAIGARIRAIDTDGMEALPS